MAAAPSALVLVGFMGAGKTTVGRLVAERLGWRFVDLDAEIERRTGESIDELFRTLGEPGFRQHEAAATAALAPLDRTVLATGGGWFLDPAARARLGAPALVVLLRIEAATAVARLANEPRRRPLLAQAGSAGELQQRITALLREREAAYARADRVLDVDAREPADIARAIAAWLAAQ